MRDPKERLRDILEAIAAIERYRARGKNAFEQDELLRAWFVRHLQIIGEAARALPEATLSLAPSMPWPKIIGMRNVLVHGYFDIDAELVWAAVEHDVPDLKAAVERLLQELEHGARKAGKPTTDAGQLAPPAPPPRPKKRGRKNKGSGE